MIGLIVWGKDYYIASYPGDRQLWSKLSIEILPYSQLSGGKVTKIVYRQFKGEILLYSQLSVIGLLFNNCFWERLLYSQLSGG